jgi:hypothetical protein
MYEHLNKKIMDKAEAKPPSKIGKNDSKFPPKVEQKSRSIPFESIKNVVADNKTSVMD